MDVLIMLILLAIAYALVDAYVIPDGPFKLAIRGLVVLALVVWLLTSGRTVIHQLVGG